MRWRPGLVRGTAALLCVGACGPLAAGAQAATVQVATVKSDADPALAGPAEGVLALTAPAGEHNAISIALGPGASYEVADGGAPLTVGAGCVALTPNTARCGDAGAPRIGSVEVDAGDGDDSIAVPAVQREPTIVSGGDGADAISGQGSLYGGPGNDQLTGGPGRDELWGGPGDDVLRGGGDRDMLSGDGARDGSDLGGGNDTLDGGEGIDTVSYRTRAAPIRVDLRDPGPDGAAGERDVLSGVEAVFGGSGADVLLGSDANDDLQGGDGNDNLNGRGGDDGLQGGGGSDLAYGGPGNDSILAEDAGDRSFGEAGNDQLARLDRRAFISGGPGNDALAVSGANPLGLSCGAGIDELGPGLTGQLVPRNCERVQLDANAFFVVSSAPARPRPNLLSMSARCVRKVFPSLRGCRATLTLRLRRPGGIAVLLATRKVVVPVGSARTVVMALSPRARLALRPRSVVEVGVRGSGIEAANPQTKAPASVLNLLGRWRAQL